MAHFAKLDDNNIVLAVNVISNDDIDPNNEEESGIAFLTQWSNGYTNWKQTSYNGSFRKHFAGIGFTYDEKLDAFIYPKCHDEAILNTQTCVWECNNSIHNLGSI